MLNLSSGKLLLRAFAVAYVLVFGEIFIRCLSPVPLMPRYVTGAPYGVRVGMPNMRFWQTTPETRVEIRTNSRGIRSDREYSYAKPPGVCRIVLLGDSLFVGYEVNIEDSFAYLLNEKLDSAGYKCEVINLAVSGFGTAEMLIALQEEGLKYHPDIVVFSSHFLDLDDNIRSSLYTLNDEQQLVRKSASFLPGIGLSDELARFAVYRWLSENSQLYSAVREHAALTIKALLVSLKMPDNPPSSVDKGKSPGHVEHQDGGFPERLNLRLLEEAKRVSEANHAKFCVLEIPYNLTRTDFVTRLPEYDQQIKNQLHIFRALPALQSAASPTKELYFEKGQGHLTPLGNRLLTDYMFSELAHTGWLKR